MQEADHNRSDEALSSPGTPVIEAEARATQEDEDMDSLEFDHLPEYEPDSESDAEVKPPEYEPDFESDAEVKRPEGKRARLKAATEVTHEKAEREELKALMSTATVKKISKDQGKLEEFKLKIKNKGQVLTLSKG